MTGFRRRPAMLDTMSVTLWLLHTALMSGQYWETPLNVLCHRHQMCSVTLALNPELRLCYITGLLMATLPDSTPCQEAKRPHQGVRALLNLQFFWTTSLDSSSIIPSTQDSLRSWKGVLTAKSDRASGLSTPRSFIV